MMGVNRAAMIAQLTSPTLGEKGVTVRRENLMAAAAQLASPKPIGEGRGRARGEANRVAATAQLAPLASVGAEMTVRRTS